jgi:hypothetical protein
MDPSIFNYKAAEDFSNEGAFVAIYRYVREGQLSAEQAASLISRMYLLYDMKVKEAQKEVRRIDAVLARLAHLTTQGQQKRPYEPRDAMLLSLANECTTFDNWVMSLYETDLSMISYARPDRAKAKPIELAKAFEALHKKRLDDMNFALNAPELFKLG